MATDMLFAPTRHPALRSKSLSRFVSGFKMHLAAEEYESAETELRRYLRSQPDDASATTLLAQVHRRKISMATPKALLNSAKELAIEGAVVGLVNTLSSTAKSKSPSHRRHRSL